MQESFNPLLPDLELRYIYELHKRWNNEDLSAPSDFINKLTAIWHPLVSLPHGRDYQPAFDRKEDSTLRGWSTASKEEFQWLFIVAQCQDLLPSLQAFLWEALWRSNHKWKAWKTQFPLSISEVLQHALESHRQAALWFENQEHSWREFYIARHWLAIATLLAQSKQPAPFQFDDLERLQKKIRNLPVKLALIESEIKIIQVAHVRDEARLKALLEDIGNLYEKTFFYNSHLLEKIAELETEVSKILGIPIDQKEFSQSLELRLAKTYERFACQDTPQSKGHHILFRDHLLRAASHYRQAGRKSDEERMKKLALENEAALQMNTYSAQIPVSLDHITQFQDAVLGNTENVDTALFSVSEHLVRQALRWNSDVQRFLPTEPSLFSRLAQVQVSRHGRPITTLPTEDVDLFSVQESLLACYQTEVFLLFQGIRRKFSSFSKEDLLRVFQSSPWVSEETVGIFEAVCDRYFDDDFISTIHIILPRIEALVRTIIKSSGESGSKLSSSNSAGLEEVLLEGLLELGKEIFGEEIPRFLRLLLSKEGLGLNLRNDGMHGLFTTKDCNRGNAELCLQIALFLAQYNIGGIDPKNSENLVRKGA